MFKYGFSLLLVMSLASPVLAQESAEQLARESAEESEEYSNAVDVLLGATTETDPTLTAFTIGLGYLRRLSPFWTVGVAGEFATSSVLREWLIFANVYIRPAGGLVLGTGPGIEGALEKASEDEEGEQTSDFAWRFFVGWEFEVGSRYTISPEVNLDLIGGEVAWVYGVAFGVQF